MISEAIVEKIRIPTPGATITGTLIRAPAPRLAVLINAATGVQASFYAPFAQWLALERNAMVLIWDYRDFGASGRVKRSGATMTDWGLHDATAVRDWLCARAGVLPVWVIGHSLGGMTMGFQPRTEYLERIITVAAGFGHVTDHPWPFQAKAWLLWYLVGPICIALRGYLPGRALGLGNDLPSGVFWQWRRWLLDRRGVGGDPDFGGIRNPGFSGPVTCVAFRDDHMIPPHAVRRMAAWFPGARVEQRLIDPAEHGLESIGHIHAFAPRNRAIWPYLIAP